MSKKTLFFIFCVALAFVFWSYEKLIDNVHVRYFYLDTWPKISKISYTKEEKEAARKILAQPFSYLGKGRQFFVFESQDKKWILKFLKCQRYDVWYADIPFLQERACNRKAIKNEKVHSTFLSLQLAATSLADVTGVTFCHLKKEADLKTRVTLKDPLGFSHTLLVDEVPFVIQKKASLVFPTLEKLYEKHDIEALKNRLQELLQLQVDLVKRGCIDRDDGALLRDNIGFLSDRAIYVDIGTFCVDDSARRRLDQDLERFRVVAKWLKHKDSQLQPGQLQAGQLHAWQLHAWFEWQMQKTCLEHTFENRQ